MSKPRKPSKDGDNSMVDYLRKHGGDLYPTDKSIPNIDRQLDEVERNNDQARHSISPTQDPLDQLAEIRHVNSIQEGVDSARQDLTPEIRDKMQDSQKDDTETSDDGTFQKIYKYLWKS